MTAIKHTNDDGCATYDYYLAEDYAKLEAENERLRGLLEPFMCDCPGDEGEGHESYCEWLIHCAPNSGEPR